MNNKTHLLPPVTAIKMVWARTGALSSDPHSQILAGQAELAAKEIRERAEGVEHEERYVISAFAALDACYRNLDIIHKKRNQDFQQNEKLRNAYFETVKENLEFGTKAKDFLQSLPSVTIGGAGGLTLAEVLGLSMRPVWSWVFALGLASAGYLFNLLIVRLMRKKKQMLYVLQDYERGKYYNQYIDRAITILTSLYTDLGRIHRNVFGQNYPREEEEIKSGERGVVEGIFEGIRTSYCPLIHRHMQARKVTPDLWPTCEVGSPEERKNCSNWEGER